MYTNSKQSSSDKDKAAPPRTAANKAKPAPTKKTTSTKDMGDQSQSNGSQPLGNGVDRHDDVEMGDDTAGGPTSSFNTSKDQNGDKKMTVVVPPAKGLKSSGDDRDVAEGDVEMKGTEDETAESQVSPAKTVQGWCILETFFFFFFFFPFA